MFVCSSIYLVSISVYSHVKLIEIIVVCKYCYLNFDVWIVLFFDSKYPRE